MEKLRYIILLHILLTLLLLQIALGISLISTYGLISFAMALSIPCLISLYVFYKELIKDDK